MDRNFARALSLVLKSEGGWSDDSRDPGGATMKGVTLANFRRYVQSDGTKDDLRHITDAQLATVYRKFYWDEVKGDDLPDGVDYATFDFAVNSGPSRAAKYLQTVVGVPEDGVIGPATLDAVRAKSAATVLYALCDARLAFLKRLPTWGTFGTGWASRVASVRADALRMTTQAPQPAPPAPIQPIPAPVQPPAPPAAPVPPPVAREPQPIPAKPRVEGSGIIAGLITALALTAMAIGGAWHHVIAYIEGILH
jgi:lysozyme family protein